MDILHGELIKLRALEPEDVEILYRWENDPDVWKVSNTVAPFSKYVLRQFIESQRADIFESRQLRLIVESKAGVKPVGTIDLFEIDPFNLRAGVGILIYDHNDRRKGFAADALSTLIRYSFTVLGLHQLYCNVPTSNTQSLSLFKSKGFTVIGIKKEWTKTTSDWQDEYMLQLLSPKVW